MGWRIGKKTQAKSMSHGKTLKTGHCTEASNVCEKLPMNVPYGVLAFGGNEQQEAIRAYQIEAEQKRAMGISYSSRNTMR
jgi:hypothetical protein